MKKILLIILIITFSNSYSQGNNYSTYRLVIFDNLKNPLPNIQTNLFPENSRIVMEVRKSDLKGTVVFTIEKEKIYDLTIHDSNYFVFSKRISNPVLLGSSYNDTVILKPKIISTPIIRIESNKNFMTTEDEKIIFDISKLKGNSGINALELMKKIPMLTVENESVLLRGKAPVILINGRQSQLYGDVRTIPTDLIDKLEIYTITPSKFEADGSGVINIVLKNFEEVKYRVFVSSLASSNNAFNSYIGGSYKKNKLSLFTNANANLSNLISSSVSAITNTATNEITSMTSDTDRFKSKYLSINGGSIYDLNEHMYFGIESVIGINPSIMEGKTIKEYAASSNQFLINNNTTDFNNFSLITYGNKTGLFKKDELNVELSFKKTKYNSDSKQSEILSQSEKQLLNNESNITNNNLEGKIDYTNNFSKLTKLELGFKHIWKKENNDYDLNDTVHNISSNYEFQQSIFSSYGTLSFMLSEVRIKPGIRIEYADLGGIVNSVSEFTNFKFDVFPSLSVTKFFADNSQIQFLYGKKIERPRFNTLNPYILNRDVYNSIRGNPDLEPSYTHNLEVKFSKPFGKIYINTGMNFQRTVNLIQSIRAIDSLFTHTTFTNNGNLTEIGFDGSLNINFLDYFYSSIYGSINKKIFSDETLNSGLNQLYYNCNFYTGYSNPATFNIDISTSYSGQRYTPNKVSNSYIYFFINLSKSFLNKKLRVGLNIVDPFNSSGSEIKYIENGFEQYYKYNGNSSQYFGLNINFIFGNYDENRKKGKSETGDEYSN